LSTGSYETSIKNVRYTVVSQRIDAIAGTALFMMPKSNFLTAGQMGFLLLLSIVIIFAATLTIATLVSRLLLKKLLHLSNTINGIDLNHINQSVPIESPDETGQLAHNFNTMLNRLNRSFEREKHLLFAQLTSNMRPHFICNILEMLRIQAEKEQQGKIANSIAKINQYFRYSIMYTQNMVSLAEELSDTINYIELVNLMRQNKIRYNVSYDAWSEVYARQVKIPKQIIQPVVENSIRHGLSRKIAGCITIQVNRIENGIKIVVSDNGSGMSKEKLEELRTRLKGEITHEPESGRHMGLINVVKRLELRMNEQFDLSIESHEGTGTIITIMIYQVPDNPLES
jgi:two-component system, sensor histidine kinase YesM